MKLTELLQSNRPTVSCELFPPKPGTALLDLSLIHIWISYPARWSSRRFCTVIPIKKQAASR